MGDFTVGDLAQIVSIFDQRSQEIAAAKRLVSSRALGTENANIASFTSSLPDQAFRTITLELLRTPQNNSQQTAAGPPLPIIGSVTSRTTFSLNKSITLAVGANSDGYAQSFSITRSARQAEHQSVMGNYIDEWGVAIGQLAVDVIVTYGARGASPGAAIQPFFDELDYAKRSTPLDGSPPAILRYHDTLAQRSLIISQTSISLRESVQEPNLARLSINASILHDYGTQSFGSDGYATLADSTSSIIDIATGAGLRF